MKKGGSLMDSQTLIAVLICLVGALSLFYVNNSKKKSKD